MKKRTYRIKFGLIAIAIITFGSLIIALSLPVINSYKTKAVDNLMKQAENAQNKGDFRKYRGLIEQANIIGITDQRPLTNLANYYQSINRTDLALSTYERLITKDYLKFGNLALDAQDYIKAEQSFLKAIKKDSGVTSYSGLAITLFNQGKIKEGCQISEKAINLNLNDERALAARAVCDKLKDANISSLDRSTAYFLLQNKVLKIGETALNNAGNKIPNDYLVLAQISAARGDYKLAIGLAKRGLEIDKTHLELNKALYRYLDVTGDKTGLAAQKKVLDNLILNDI